MIYENEYWRAEPCVGAMGVGSIVVKTQAHRENLWQLTSEEAASLGEFLRLMSEAIVRALGAERVYVSLWVDEPPYHVHFVLQPRYPKDVNLSGAKGLRLQLIKSMQGKPHPDQMVRTAEQIRAYLRASGVGSCA